MSLPSNDVLTRDPTIPVDQGIYESNATQQAPLGTRLKLSDRTYYYAQATAASIGAGQVVCSTLPTASHQSGIFTIAAAVVGTSHISGTSSANVAANYYAEGYFGAAAGAGVGQIYKIRSQASGSAGMDIALYDGLATALTSGVVFWMIANPYRLVNVSSQNLGHVVGVAPIDVTTSHYFWLQSWGPANPLHVAAEAAGGALRLGTTGSVTTAFTATTNDATTPSALIIGKNIGLASTAGQGNPVYLKINP